MLNHLYEAMALPGVDPGIVLAIYALLPAPYLLRMWGTVGGKGMEARDDPPGSNPWTGVTAQEATA
jgi:hypothetical protein